MPRLLIDALTYGGRGVGRLDGKAVFVPLSAPGDEIEVDLAEERKRYATGRIRQLLNPGQERREPPCEVYGDCGGCQWQHLDYGSQLRWKEQLFGDILQRQAGVDISLVLPIVASDDEWHYRNRVQLKCHALGSGMAIGFYRSGTHFVTNIEHCPIAAHGINRAIRWLRPLLETAPRPERIPQVDIGCGDDEAIRLVIHHLDPIDPDWINRVGQAVATEGYSLFLQSGRKETLTRVCGRDDLFLRLGVPPLTLAYGPGGFAQVNSSQNRKLVEAVIEAAAVKGHERVLDLYCGMGNFSLPLARCCSSLIGVEEYPPSIAKAKQNACDNGIDNARFFALPAQAAQQVRSLGPFDLVLLDPPREGASQALDLLQQLSPRTIIYVSCDPMTLARDLKSLVNGGYHVRFSRPFDLFPQTYHIESLTVLDRN